MLLYNIEGKTDLYETFMQKNDLLTNSIGYIEQIEQMISILSPILMKYIIYFNFIHVCNKLLMILSWN